MTVLAWASRRLSVACLLVFVIVFVFVFVVVFVVGQVMAEAIEAVLV